jgi:hypothetical protein
MPIKIVQCCLLVSILSGTTCSKLSAQSLSEYKVGKEEFFDNGHWGFALSFSNMSNAVAPNPSSHSVSALSMKIDFKKYRFGSGKRRFYFQNKTIGDLLTLLGNRDKGRGENSALTTGLIGWSSWG